MEPIAEFLNTHIRTHTRTHETNILALEEKPYTHFFLKEPKKLTHNDIFMSIDQYLTTWP